MIDLRKVLPEPTSPSGRQVLRSFMRLREPRCFDCLWHRSRWWSLKIDFT